MSLDFNENEYDECSRKAPTMARVKNRADIAVTYADGCRASWKTRPTAPLASDVVKFAKWLQETADSIMEAATTQGMCDAKDKQP